MLFKYVFGFVVIAAALADDCDHLGITLYEDLGCTPHHDESKPCPVKYSCQGLEETDKCYFRGRTYADKESVDENLSDLSCDRACSCSSEQGRASFVCAILDCPEWLGVPDKPGCYSNYSLNECCSVGQICPPFDEEAKCIVDGVEYKEGQNFYPNNTCLTCVCQKGFNGKFEEPFCRRQSCGIQLKGYGGNLKKRCAPFYHDEFGHSLCCPYQWICPEGSEDIEGDVTSDDVCMFGDTTLKVGQKFIKLNVYDGFGKTIERVECKCLIPPLLTCYKTD